MENDIQKAVEALRKGEIILYPTDTIWGIGCDATNNEAVAKIYALKKRADSKSMLVLVDSFDRVFDYIEDVPEVAENLVGYADKPLTVIYPNAINLANNLIASDGSIGIRVAKEDFCQKLIKRFNRPIVSTSANISGEPSPQNFSEINLEVVNACDYVVGHKQNDNSKAQPSSIIKLEVNGEFKIIRK